MGGNSTYEEGRVERDKVLDAEGSMIHLPAREKLRQKIIC